jgi:ribose-phosphate pyrophosphokinase
MKIEKKLYPDGTFYPLITELKDNYPNTYEYLTFNINSYEDLWFLKQIKDTLDSMNVACNLTIPCFLDGQADKRFEKNSSANLKLICTFINDMKWRQVNIFHPHNQEVVEALIDNVHVIDNTKFIIRVLEEINHVEEVNEPDMVILAPDSGAYKWISKLCDKINWSGELQSASKSRKYINGKSMLTQQLPNFDFKGKNVLIIDDIIIGGGSVIGLSKLLKEAGCNKLYVAASHITIQQPNPLLWNNFKTVFTTNSKNIEYTTDKIFGDDQVEIKETPKNLTIINLF